MYLFLYLTDVKTDPVVRTKMKIISFILSVFCVTLVAQGEEIHSIDRRILENQESPYISEYESNHTDLRSLPSLEDVAALKNPPTLVQNASSAIDPAANSTISSADQGSLQLGNVTLIDKDDLNATPVKITSTSVNTSAVDQVEHNRVNVTALLRVNTSEIDSTDLSQPLTPYQNLSIARNKTEKPIDTEVKDLLNKDSKETQDVPLVNNQYPLEPQEPIHIPDKIDKETELIDDGDNTEDVLRRHQDEQLIDTPRGPIAIILVSSFVILSLLCYAGMLIWRRYLEDRYGSRTLLVDAEELADPNDLKHFSI